MTRIYEKYSCKLATEYGDYIVKKVISKKFHQPWKGPYEIGQAVEENTVDLISGKSIK